MRCRVGQDPNVYDFQRQKSRVAATNLKNLLQPILLQRKKTDFKDVLQLPEKLEIVMWVPLSSKQRALYCKYLEGRELEKVLSQSTYPIEAVNYLKTLCRHPFLTEATVAVKQGRTGGGASNNSVSDLAAALGSMGLSGAALSTSSSRGNSCGSCSQPYGVQEQRRRPPSFDHQVSVCFMVAEMVHECYSQGSYHKLCIINMNLMCVMGVYGIQDSKEDCREASLREDPTSVFSIVGRTPSRAELVCDSMKLQVFLRLLQQLRGDGHRTLVFSQSKLMLDILQHVLADIGVGSYRIDGSVGGRERQSIIDNMNDTDSRIDVCLLTTKACGFGITLTGADRVIVYDPSWNPAEDRQAVDRAYRIGQKNKVIVYRMIMAGSIEEKMYEKQVFKDGLRVVSERGASSRYFSDQETKELFTLDSHTECACMRRLWGYAEDCKIMTCPDMPTQTPLDGVMGYSKHDALYLTSVQQQKQLTQSQSRTPVEKDSLDLTSVEERKEDPNDFEDQAQMAPIHRQKLSQQKIDSVFQPTDSSQKRSQEIPKPAWPSRNKPSQSSRPAWPVRTGVSRPAPPLPLLIDLTDDSPEASPEASPASKHICTLKTHTTREPAVDMSCEDLLKDLEKLHVGVMSKTHPPEELISAVELSEEQEARSTDKRAHDTKEDVNNSIEDCDDMPTNDGSEFSPTRTKNICTENNAVVIEKDHNSNDNSDDDLCRFDLDLQSLHNTCDDSDGDSGGSSEGDGDIRDTDCFTLNDSYHDSQHGSENLADSDDSDSDDEAGRASRLVKPAGTSVSPLVDSESEEGGKSNEEKRDEEEEDTCGGGFITSGCDEEDEDLCDSEDETERASRTVNSRIRLMNRTTRTQEQPVISMDEQMEEEGIREGTQGFLIADSVYEDSDTEDEEKEEGGVHNEQVHSDSSDSDSEDEVGRASRLMNSRIRLTKLAVVSVSPLVDSEREEEGKSKERKREEEEEEDTYGSGFITSGCDEEDEEEEGLSDSDDDPERTNRAVNRRIRLTKHVVKEPSLEDDGDGGNEEEDTCGGFIVPDSEDEDEEEEEEELSDSEEDEVGKASRFVSGRTRLTQAESRRGKSSIFEDEERESEEEQEYGDEDDEDDTCGGFIVPDSEDEDEEEEDEEDEEDLSDSEDELDRTTSNKANNYRHLKKGAAKASSIFEDEATGGGKVSDEEDEEDKEEDDSCGGFIVPDSEDEDKDEEEEELSDSEEEEHPFTDYKENKVNSKPPCEVIDLLDSASEDEFSPTKPKSVRNRRHTIKSKPKPFSKSEVATFATDLRSFRVESISPLALQRSHHEMKKKSPVLHKLVVHSRKTLNMLQINEYNDHLGVAHDLEARQKWKESAAQFLKAMAICDDDKSLHQKLFLLEKMIR